MALTIRKYCINDEESVRQICCDTGFLGKPIDSIFQDRELFADLLTKPYLTNEPQNAIVADHDGTVSAYLLSSIDPYFEVKALPHLFISASKMIFRTITGRYSQHQRSKKFAKWVLFKGLFELPKHPKNASHLHINIARECRGGDLGLQLLSEYENMLHARGIDHYYGEIFSSETRRKENLYRRLGFQIFDKVKTTIFEPEVTDPLYLMSIHKIL